MKRIITLIILMLLIKGIAFCQEIEYYEHDEYEHDSTGVYILIENPEYKLISTINESSWGIKNREGGIVIPLGKYQLLVPIGKGMIIAQKDGKAGVIDITEQTLIPFIYDKIGAFSNCTDLAPVIKNKKQGFINRKGEIIIPLEYDTDFYSAYFREPGLAILMKKGKYGVIDSCNNIIIPFKYSKIEQLENQDYFIVTKDQEWSCFSFNGKPLSNFSDYVITEQTKSEALPLNKKNIPFPITTSKYKKNYSNLFYNEEYRNATQQKRDSIEISIGKEYAYIDKFQNIIVPFGTYDYIESFGLGRKAIVANKHKYGIINEHGKVVLPLDNDLIEHPYQYSNYANYFIVTKKDKIILYDENINVIPTEGIVSYRYGNADLLVSDIHNKKGRVNYNGELTIPFEYDTLYHFNARGLIATKENMYGFISEKNQIIQPFEYSKIYQLTDDLVFINKNGKAGIYDEQGKIKIPFEYDAIYNTFYNNFEPEETKYIVIKEGKAGTIDIHNNVIIPIIYDGLSSWVENGPKAHFVKNKGKFGLISHEGRIIIPIEYEYVGLPQASVIVVRKNGKYGAISWNNKEILPCIYDNIFDDIPDSDLRDEKDEKKGKLVTLQNNTWSYFDLKGKLIHKNIPIDEIMKNYGNRFAWGEPSNEKQGFDIKQANKEDY